MLRKNGRHIAFAAALLLFIGVVGGLILTQERILKQGETTILETRPVDPRDLFRGEYVILRYAIETGEVIEREISMLPDGYPVYLKLVEDERGIGRVERVTTRDPKINIEEGDEADDDDLWVRGEMEYGRVRFRSLEQFYVPEGAGGQIEQLRNDLHVEVSLRDGEARIIRLLDANLNEIDPSTMIQLQHRL